MQRQAARTVRRGAAGKALPRGRTLADRLPYYFLDLPGAAEKEPIWRMYTEKFGLDPDQRRPQERDWTGAEIRSCCRLAALLDITLIEAAQNVVPVAVTAGESVERLRDWAAGRCLAADRPGLYSRALDTATRPGRKVRRDPSSN